jgi:hypothetical protein
MTNALTIVHVAISLVGMGAGFVVMWGLSRFHTRRK